MARSGEHQLTVCRNLRCDYALAINWDTDEIMTRQQKRITRTLKPGVLDRYWSAIAREQ